MARRKSSKKNRRETMLRDSRSLSPMEKAVFHQRDGAGKSRVKRQFFELNEQDLTDIVELLESRLRARLS